MTEIWVDVCGFEGRYQVSNIGNVRSLPRIEKDKNGRAVRHTGKVLIPRPNSVGYLRVQLKSPNRNERWFVHRLVATHFVDNPNPERLTIVNHLDCNYLNNAAENLEWTTSLGNTRHALANGRLDRTDEWLANQRKALKKYDRPVLGCDPKTNSVVVSFDSIQEAGRNGYESSSVCVCCQGKRKTHKGLYWRHKEER